MMQTNPQTGPVERQIHRMLAPRHVRGSLQFSDGGVLEIPASGVVWVAGLVEYPGDEVVEGVFGRPVALDRTHRLRELLQLGFAVLPAAGPSDQRPEGRFDGEVYFDETLHKPLWWSDGAWRDAMGAPA